MKFVEEAYTCMRNSCTRAGRVLWGKMDGQQISGLVASGRPPPHNKMGLIRL